MTELYKSCPFTIITYIVSGSTKATIMCIIFCFFEAIVRIFTTILLMFDNMIRMFLYNLYNILSVFCQICSVLPLCMVIIITSNLKCLICNRSNICCAGAQGQCPLLTSLVMLIVLYFVLDAFHGLDRVFNALGYVKDHHGHSALKENDTHSKVHEHDRVNFTTVSSL